MMNRLFRLLLTLNATFLPVIVFFVQQKHTLGYFFPNTVWLTKLHYFLSNDLDFNESVIHFISYTFYFIIPTILTKVSIRLSSRLSKDKFNKGDIISIEHANNSFLPSYLGYFFVALSISHWESLFFVYCILFMFTYKSQALYFNPLFLLFGYEFYNVKTRKGSTLFLISRAKYRIPDDVEIETAYRINNYTFIERSK